MCTLDARLQDVLAHLVACEDQNLHLFFGCTRVLRELSKVTPAATMTGVDLRKLGNALKLQGQVLTEVLRLLELVEGRFDHGFPSGLDSGVVDTVERLLRGVEDAAKRCNVHTMDVHSDNRCTLPMRVLLELCWDVTPEEVAQITAPPVPGQEVAGHTWWTEYSVQPAIDWTNLAELERCSERLIEFLDMWALETTVVEHAGRAGAFADLTCPCCQEEVSQDPQAKFYTRSGYNDRLLQLPKHAAYSCGHPICTECLLGMLRRELPKKREDGDLIPVRCPTCRHTDPC